MAAGTASPGRVGREAQGQTDEQMTPATRCCYRACLSSHRHFYTCSGPTARHPTQRSMSDGLLTVPAGAFEHRPGVTSRCSNRWSSRLQPPPPLPPLETVPGRTRLEAEAAEELHRRLASPSAQPTAPRTTKTVPLAVSSPQCPERPGRRTATQFCCLTCVFVVELLLGHHPRLARHRPPRCVWSVLLLPCSRSRGALGTCWET